VLQPFNVNCLLYECNQTIVVIAMDLLNAINQLVWQFYRGSQH
jgi:hypothetical protein